MWLGTRKAGAPRSRDTAGATGVPSRPLQRYSSSCRHWRNQQHDHRGLHRHLHALTPATWVIFPPAYPSLAPARAQGPHEQPVQAAVWAHDSSLDAPSLCVYLGLNPPAVHLSTASWFLSWRHLPCHIHTQEDCAAVGEHADIQGPLQLPGCSQRALAPSARCVSTTGPCHYIGVCSWLPQLCVYTSLVPLTTTGPAPWT